MTKKRRNLRILASIIAAGCVWATGMGNAFAAGGTGWVYNPELGNEAGTEAGLSPNVAAYGYNHNYYLQYYDRNKNFNVAGDSSEEIAYDKTWDNADATYCEYTLKDSNGTVVASGNGNNKVRVAASGITTASGTLTITWYKDVETETKVLSDVDMTGDGIVDENDFTIEKKTERQTLGTSTNSVSFDKE